MHDTHKRNYAQFGQNHQFKKNFKMGLGSVDRSDDLRSLVKEKVRLSLLQDHAS